MRGYMCIQSTAAEIDADPLDFLVDSDGKRVLMDLE